MTPAALRIAAALAAGAFALPATAAADVPEGATWQEAYIESTDGVTLHADVMRPKDLPADAKTPVILSIGPYFAHSAEALTDFDPTKQGPSDRFDDLLEQGKVFQRGYSVVYVDARGFGGSTGCNDFGGKGEQADAKAAIEWAAAQSWSNGKVGTWGKSYDGWTQVMANAMHPKGLAASVIQSPIIDGYRTLYQNGVHYDSGWYGTPALYQGIDATPPTIFDSPEYVAGFAQGTNPLCYSTNIALQNTTLDGTADFWKERELTPRASQSTVPILWSHGFLDANTKPDNFLPVYSKLTGPKRAWFGQYDHVRPSDKDGGSFVVGRAGWIDEAMRWFDRYLKGLPEAQAPVDKDPTVEVQDSDGRWRSEAQWPPADAHDVPLKLRGGTYTDSIVSPTSFRTATAPFPYDARIAGAPRIEIQATTSALRGNLFVLVYDVAADGTSKLVTRSAHVVSGNENDLRFDLYPEDWIVHKGHRLLVEIAGDDADWYLPPHSEMTVTVEPDGVLHLPFLRYVRTPDLTGKQSLAFGTRGDGPTFDSAVLDAAKVPFTFPAALVPRPKAASLSAALTRSGSGLKVAGRAPTGARITVQLSRARAVVATKRVKARHGRYAVRFAVRRAGSYRATATTRFKGQTFRRTTKAIKVR